MSEHIFSVIMSVLAFALLFANYMYVGSLYTVTVHHIIRVEAG